MTPAVFLDKDGTLVHNVPWNVDPRKIRLAPYAAIALRRLAAAGFKLVLVTNQPGLAQGRFIERELFRSLDRLRRLLADESLRLDGIYFCPHDPAGRLPWLARPCACRKPAAGMLHAAAAALHIDLARSWMIGDILDDVEAGNRAGCRTVLLDVGNETEWMRGPYRRPDRVCRNLARAADLVLSAQAERRCFAMRKVPASASSIESTSASRPTAASGAAPRQIAPNTFSTTNNVAKRGRP